MRPTLDIPADPATLEALLRPMVKLARADLLAHKLPALYRSGVRYVRERPGREEWQLPSQVYAGRRGDCEDLAVWRSAEYQLGGTPAWPYVYWSGPHQLHVIVRTPYHFEDPSRILGMGSQRGTMRARIRRHRSGGHHAHLEPMPGFYVGASGDSAEAALHSAAVALDHALSNPVVRAAMPPGTAATISLVRGAAAALRRGGLRGLDAHLKRLPSKAAKHTLKVLRKVLPW